MKTIVLTATIVLAILWLLRFRGSAFTTAEIMSGIESMRNAGR